VKAFWPEQRDDKGGDEGLFWPEQRDDKGGFFGLSNGATRAAMKALA
jgi:hypothetical protein